MVDDVPSRVRAPALALTASGAAGACVHLGILVWTGVSVAMSAWQGGELDALASVGRALFATGGLVGGVLAMLGGRSLLSLRGLRWVWTGVGAQSVPCCAGALWPIGLAIAGWVAFAMQDEEVRAAFGDPT